MFIFAIDDSPSVLSFLRQVIAKTGQHDIVTFLDPAHALQVIRTQPVDLILVDFTMPGINGIELITQVRQMSGGHDIPIIMLTSQTDSGLKIAAIEAGATEFLTKPIDASELSVRVRNLLDLRQAQKLIAERAQALEHEITAATDRIAEQEREIIWRLSKAMACRDGETATHLERVAVVAGMIARELGQSRAWANRISLASPLHDVGKIGVPDAVLLKPGKLTEEEMEQMRAHAAFGAEILGNSSSEIIQTAARIAESHHEKWNGTGYPKGLAGDEIPIEGRIVAIADVFDALCSERPYKKSWPVDEAYREILRCDGTHFDPACVAAFTRLWDAIRPLYAKGTAERCPSDQNQTKSGTSA